jgi:hypothetical protein
MLAEVFQNAVTLESPLLVFQRLAKIVVDDTDHD